MKESLDSNTLTTKVEKTECQSETKTFGGSAWGRRAYIDYPRITIEEIKAFLQEEANARNPKSSKYSRKTSKVMKFKFLDAKDSETGVPELITTTTKPNDKQHCKSDKPGKVPRVIHSPNRKPVDSRNDAESSTSTITSHSGNHTHRRKHYSQISVNPTNIPKRILRDIVSEMDSRQLTTLFRPFTLAKLESIQRSISQILDAQNRELLAAKQAKIETLKREIEDLQPNAIK